MNLKNILCFLFLAGLAIPVISVAQKLEAGPQVLCFHSEVDDTEQPYGLYLPENYDAAKKYPLVIMLHGAGSNHRLALRRVFGKSNINGETDVEASRYFPEWKNRNYIVATPFARGTMGYQGIAEKDVLDVMADVKRRFSIDENRTYLTGLSMGGGGTLWLGLSYPDIWAAIAPVCPAAPEGTAVLASNALNIPVHIFHGDADPVVRPEGVREWVKNLEKEGVNVEYSEYPGVAHDSWVNAYEEGSVFDWFDQFERNRYPSRVKLSTGRYAGASAYWLHINAFTPGEVAKIDAHFVANNQLEITSENIQVFTLNLEGHKQFRKGQAMQIMIDGNVIELRARSSITLGFSGSSWGLHDSKFPKLFKRKGMEGPMSEAIAGRHIYVYGTGGDPSEEELEKRRQQAEKAAEWSYYRGEFLGRIMVFPRVLNDQQLRPSDFESSNLILFGDKTTNSAIASFSDQLPLQLTGSPEEYGLAFIFPIGNRYVLVNSGISIMDAPDSDKEIAMISRMTSPAIRYSLNKFEDYVLYTRDRIISSGRFTNEWKLPNE